MTGRIDDWRRFGDDLGPRADDRSRAPLRTRWSRLERRAPFILQIGVGAGIAWLVAHDLLGHRLPFFAPITAAIRGPRRPRRRDGPLLHEREVPKNARHRLIVIAERSSREPTTPSLDVKRHPGLVRSMVADLLMLTGLTYAEAFDLVPPTDDDASDR